MDVSRALSQIAEIHQQIAKGELYRGYRPLPVAASGLIGIVAASLQPRDLPVRDPVAFVWYWCAVAGLAGLVGVSEIAYNYVREDDAERRRTRRVVGQFLPSMVGAAAITASFVHVSDTLIPLLPGLWAICFGIGVFASRPYLPRASGFVALFYYAAGIALLWQARGNESLHGWWTGATFGIGQLFAALVLYWHVERREDLSEEQRS
jgi:TctA family transporter